MFFSTRKRNGKTSLCVERTKRFPMAFGQSDLKPVRYDRFPFVRVAYRRGTAVTVESRVFRVILNFRFICAGTSGSSFGYYCRIIVRGPAPDSRTKRFVTRRVKSSFFFSKFAAFIGRANRVSTRLRNNRRSVQV